MFGINGLPGHEQATAELVLTQAAVSSAIETTDRTAQFIAENPGEAGAAIYEGTVDWTSRAVFEGDPEAWANATTALTEAPIPVAVTGKTAQISAQAAARTSAQAAKYATVAAARAADTVSKIRGGMRQIASAVSKRVRSAVERASARVAPRTYDPDVRMNGFFESFRPLAETADQANRRLNVGESIDIRKFDFGAYLREKVGGPPAGMPNPHAHHILFKKGLGKKQQALVRQGQALLSKYDIDPIFGVENLTWAPQRIKGQHDLGALKQVVQTLTETDELFGSRDAMVRALKELGQTAAERR